jgi:hypothetical protein
MKGNTADHEQTDEDILNSEISDEALESAASMPPGGAISLPGSPTVSILVQCCG